MVVCVALVAVASHGPLGAIVRIENLDAQCTFLVGLCDAEPQPLQARGASRVRDIAVAFDVRLEARDAGWARKAAAFGVPV